MDPLAFLSKTADKVDDDKEFLVRYPYFWSFFKGMSPRTEKPQEDPLPVIQDQHSPEPEQIPVEVVQRDPCGFTYEPTSRKRMPGFPLTPSIPMSAFVRMLGNAGLIHPELQLKIQSPQPLDQKLLKSTQKPLKSAQKPKEFLNQGQRRFLSPLPDEPQLRPNQQPGFNPQNRGRGGRFNNRRRGRGG